MLVLYLKKILRRKLTDYKLFVQHFKEILQLVTSRGKKIALANIAHVSL
jgi:hypothetical protein